MGPKRTRPREFDVDRGLPQGHIFFAMKKVTLTFPPLLLALAFAAL